MMSLKILEFIISVIGGFFYWVILPILAYLVLKIFLFAVNFSDVRDRKRCCRHYGYKGRRRWWE